MSDATVTELPPVPSAESPTPTTGVVMAEALAQAVELSLTSSKLALDLSKENQELLERIKALFLQKGILELQIRELGHEPGVF